MKNLHQKKLSDKKIGNYIDYSKSGVCRIRKQLKLGRTDLEQVFEKILRNHNIWLEYHKDRVPIGVLSDKYKLSTSTLYRILK